MNASRQTERNRDFLTRIRETIWRPRTVNTEHVHGITIPAVIAGPLGYQETKLYTR
jgi:hypothetical protein